MAIRDFTDRLHSHFGFTRVHLSQFMLYIYISTDVVAICSLHLSLTQNLDPPCSATSKVVRRRR